MRNTIFFIALIALTQMAFGQAGPGAIYQGPNILQLRPNIIFKDSSVKIMTDDTDDPSSVAKDAVQGSLYIRSGTGTLYQKQDNGLSTNWLPLLIGPVASGTDECVARWNGTGSPLLQDSLLCITDAGVATGLTQLNVDDLRLDGGTVSTTAGNLVLDPFASLELPTVTASSVLSLDSAQEVVGIPLDDGEFVIGSTGGEPDAGTITAVANQTTVTPSANGLTIGTVQNIGTGSSPTFAGATLTGFSGYVTAAAGVLDDFLGTANQVAGFNAAGNAPEAKSITATANQTTVTHSVGGIAIGTVQDIATGSSPTFAGATLTGFSGVLKASGGVLSASAVDLATADVTGILPAANMTAMVGASGVANGTQGVVPQPLIANELQFLRGDGSWATPSGTGVSVIGTIDSETKSANGAVIDGTDLVMQTADGTFPGLVSVAAQSFAGLKTFVDGIIDSTLTPGRVAIVGLLGRISDDAGLLYDAATNILTTGELIISNISSIDGGILFNDATGQVGNIAGFFYDTITDIITLPNINVTTTTQATKFMGMMASTSAPSAVGLQGYCYYASDLNTMFCSDNVNWNIQGVQPAIESGTYTPTGSWTGGNVTYSGRYWIFGTMAMYEMKVDLTGAPTGTTLTFNTPHTMDVANILGTGAHDAYLNLGCVAVDNGSQSYDLDVQYLSSTVIRPQLKGSAGTYVRADQSIVDPTTPYTFASGDSVTCRVMVPITGRSAGVSTYSVASSGAAQIKWINVSGCQPSTSSGTFADMVDANCTFASATTSGPVETPTSAGGIALKRSTAVRPGKYKVGFSGVLLANASTLCVFQLTDGTNVVGPIRVNGPSGTEGYADGIPATDVTYSVPTTPEWKLQAARLGGASVCEAAAASDSSSMAITMEPVDEVISLSLEDVVKMPGSGANGGKIVSFYVGGGGGYLTLCSSDPCTVYNLNGLASAPVVNRGGTGSYEVTWAGGTWTSSTSYTCRPSVTQWSSGTSAVAYHNSSPGQSATKFYTSTGSSAGGIDVAFQIDCVGK